MKTVKTYIKLTCSDAIQLLEENDWEAEAMFNDEDDIETSIKLSLKGIERKLFISGGGAHNGWQHCWKIEEKPVLEEGDLFKVVDNSAAYVPIGKIGRIGRVAHSSVGETVSVDFGGTITQWFKRNQIELVEDYHYGYNSNGDKIKAPAGYIIVPEGERYYIDKLGDVLYFDGNDDQWKEEYPVFSGDLAEIDWNERAYARKLTAEELKQGVIDAISVEDRDGDSIKTFLTGCDGPRDFPLRDDIESCITKLKDLGIL